MNLSFIQPKQQIACCFMTENGKVFEGPGWVGYQPLSEVITIGSNTDIKMVYPKNVTENIQSYNSFNSTKSLSRNIIETKKIDISAGDITVSPTQIILNFTDFNIVAYNQNNIPITLPKLESKKLKELYRGNVILLTIQRLNNPQRVSDITNIDKNYLDDILSKNRSRHREPNSRFSNYMDVIEFAKESYEQLNYLSNEFHYSMITVVSITKIPADEFNINTKQGQPTEYQSLLLTEHDLLLTRDIVFLQKENPIINRQIDVNEFKNKVLAGSRFMYIVDNDNKIGDRWHYTHGGVEKIAKLFNTGVNKQPDGLYQAQYDETMGIRVGMPIPIEDIDKLGYIYKSQEEAETGANKSEQWKQELNEKEALLRERELELRNINLTNKTDYENTLNKLKTENEELKIKSQKELNNLEAEFIKFKRDIELKAMHEKHKYENNGYTMKHYFDERKYERDDKKHEHESFIESLKTIGSVCGFAATGYVLFNKFMSKNS